MTSHSLGTNVRSTTRMAACTWFPSLGCVAAVGMLIASGCGSPAKYVETGSPQSVVSVGDVDMQDILKASSGMLESLIETGILKTANSKPAQLVIDQVVNDTSSQFDVGELLYRMREQLVNSGQATVITTFGANAEDKTAQEQLRAQAFRQGNAVDGMPSPDFSLSGKITQVKRQAGNTQQTTYTFRLTLTNIRSGVEAWTKTVDMTKQGTKNSVGF